jgi:hypothetical protein
MNPWLIYPSWQNFSSLFREISIAATEKTEFLRYHHLTSSLYFAISFIEALLNEKHRVELESEGKPEEEILFILRRGSSAIEPKKRRSFEEKFSDWPSIICGKEVKVSEKLKKLLAEFNEVRGNLTHPKSRGHDVYAELEKIDGQQLLHAVAEYAVTIHGALGEEYPYWLFGWNYLNANETACDPSRINNQQFVHSLAYLGAKVSAYDGHANNAWRNASMKDFNGYEKIAKFLVLCRECEPFDPQFPHRPRLVKTWWDSAVFERNKNYVMERSLPIGYGTFRISPMIISPITVVAKPRDEQDKNSI